MKRFAAHFIRTSPDRLYKLHYIELDERNLIRKIAPLESEICSTAFYNGTIFVSNREDFPESADPADFADPDKPVFLFLFASEADPSAEFGTGNCRSNGYIQRLC